MMDETHESDINSAGDASAGAPVPTPSIAPTVAASNGVHPNGAPSETDNITETEEIAVESDNPVDQDESPPQKQEVNGYNEPPATASVGRGQEGLRDNHSAYQLYPGSYIWMKAMSVSNN